MFGAAVSAVSIVWAWALAAMVMAAAVATKNILDMRFLLYRSYHVFLLFIDFFDNLAQWSLIGKYSGLTDAACRMIVEPDNKMEAVLMPQLKLFVAPGTCARVATIALEETEIPFETELLRMAANQQNSPEFLKLNPKGKVPTLLVDGVPLTENVAILTWLDRLFPDAALLPEAADPFSAIKQTADLAFFSATVHPTATRITMPMKFSTDAESSFELVRPKGMEAMMPIMQMIEERLEDGPWWYGESWSVVDAYLYWVWTRITTFGFPDADFPNIQRHRELSDQRPAVQRAMKLEAENIEILKSEGLFRPPR